MPRLKPISRRASQLQKSRYKKRADDGAFLTVRLAIVGASTVHVVRYLPWSR